MNHACEEMSQLSSEKLERKLSLAERAKLKMHTLMCGACRHYDANISKIHIIFDLKHKRIHSDVSLPKDKREKIKAALQDSSS